MRSQLLVTSIGEDRPGIVAHITEVFVTHGANLEESRMAILGGEFAAIMLVSVADASLPALEKDLAKLQAEGISATCRKTANQNPARFKDYGHFEISLKGADHEGIVHKVSAYLRDQSINISSVETMVVHAPITGSPLFQMKAVVQVPPSLSAADLRKNLNIIADEESVDIDLSETQKVIVAVG